VALLAVGGPFGAVLLVCLIGLLVIVVPLVVVMWVFEWVCYRVVDGDAR
jgi:hypothetical protein